MFGLFTPKRKASNTPIFFYNSLTRQKEQFVPLDTKRVKMYNCGPTVYDHMHIGNLRSTLLPDLLHRLFLYHGYQVAYTINFTDFGHLTDDADAGEDKIVNGMKKAGLSTTLENMRDYVLPYIESFKTDTGLFGNLSATTYARASDYVMEQIKLVETLEQKGYTYETSDGIYFDIAKFPAYGQIGNVDVAKLRAGARVTLNEEKRHPADFALWKKAPLGWKSRWGNGFPGWHIECTAMIFATLGKQIDVHTGGEDLMYTHHNAEIAQAECATGKHYVNYWLHNAHITINDQKLAKSLGNGIRLSELIDRGFSPFDYRYWLLTSHYRSTANFTFAALEAAKTARLRLRRLVYEELAAVTPQTPHPVYEAAIVDALNDDLDTPKAIATLWELVKDEQVEAGTKLATIQLADTLLSLGLSLDTASGQAELGYATPNELPSEVQDLLDQREAARIARNWDEADRLREAIRLQGYEVEDSREGPRVTKIQ